MPPLLSCFSWPDEDGTAIDAPTKAPASMDDVQSSGPSGEKAQGDGGAPKLTVIVHDRTGNVTVKDKRAVNRLRLWGHSAATSSVASSAQHGTWTFALDASTEKETMLLQANDHVSFQLDLKRVDSLSQRFFPCCAGSDPSAQWKLMKKATVPTTQPPEKLAAGKDLWALQTVPNSRSASVQVLLMEAIDSARWMASIPDSAPLSSLCIPGTHETLARYGYPISTCQEEASTVDVQLRAGIRFLDIRVIAKGPSGSSASGQKLLGYHGVTDERIEFGAVLQACWNFLDNEGKSETIIMSMKPEADAAAMQACFEQVYLNPTKSRWYLDVNVPTMGQARGKIVLMSRYGSSGSQPGGIHPTIWPNSLNDTFTYQLPNGQQVITQDWYDIGSLGKLDAKFALMQKLLSQAGSDTSILGLDFTNGSSFPLALPPSVALGALGYTGINARLSAYLKTLLVKAPTTQQAASKTAGAGAQTAPVWPGAMKPLMAIFNLDYYGSEADLVPLLIQANFQQTSANA